MWPCLLLKYCACDGVASCQSTAPATGLSFWNIGPAALRDLLNTPRSPAAMLRQCEMDWSCHMLLYSAPQQHCRRGCGGSALPAQKLSREKMQDHMEVRPWRPHGMFFISQERRISALCFCCFLAHRLLYGIFVICCSLLFYFAIPIPGVIQCYHLFWYVSNDYELTSWSPTVLFLGCVLFCFWFGCVGFCCSSALCFLFVLCWSLVLARWQLNGLCIDPTQFYFWCTLSILWCCHCINSRNLNMQLAFRLA